MLSRAAEMADIIIEEGKEVRVFAPATVANVACGYDVLGFAVDAPGDEVLVRFGKGKPGLCITRITGDEGRLPFEATENTAGVAALELLAHLDQEELSIEMEIHKKMPFGSGMGSSAASSVAGAFAVNQLLGAPLKKEALMPFVLSGEARADGAWHADNVGPSLMGGLVFIRNNEEVDFMALPVPDGLWAAVVHPDIEVLTKTAREILPESLPLGDVTRQVGNLGALIVACYENDLELLSRSLQDVVAEPYRKQLIPGFEEARRAAMDAGALGFSISGAGPSVFALCAGEERAQAAAAGVAQVFRRREISSQIHVSPVNREGVRELQS